MKTKLLLIICLTTFFFQNGFGQGTSLPWQRANTLGKGMNLSLWLESTYPFYHDSTNFPNPRFTQQDIAFLNSICVNTVRVPILFEAYAQLNAPYRFQMNLQEVVNGLNYIDSVIAWAAPFNMNVIIDNHMPDDTPDNNQQANYQVTDANYQQRAQRISSIWAQIATRYQSTDANHIFFEIRNEPNVVSDANLRTVYQQAIDSIRSIDNAHTLIVGCTGYYDGNALANLTPYSDNNIIYTFHTYEPFNFTTQGIGGVPNPGAYVETPFPAASSDTTYLRNMFQSIKNWSVTNDLPVWVGEFGCTTAPDAFNDHTSRCNYVTFLGGLMDEFQFPWCWWDYNDYQADYADGQGVHYFFSIFDSPTASQTDSSHLNVCFKNALHFGSACIATGIKETANESSFRFYPNPSDGKVFIVAAQEEKNVKLSVLDLSGRTVYSNIVTLNVNSPLQLNCSFDPGVYILALQNNNGVKVFKKMTIGD